MLPAVSAMGAWMKATSGFSAAITGTARPEKGSATVARAWDDHRSLPRREEVGTNGQPMAPAMRRSVMVRLVQSGSAGPVAIASCSCREGAGAG